MASWKRSGEFDQRNGDVNFDTISRLTEYWSIRLRPSTQIAVAVFNGFCLLLLHMELDNETEEVRISSFLNIYDTHHLTVPQKG